MKSFLKALLIFLFSIFCFLIWHLVKIQPTNLTETNPIALYLKKHKAPVKIVVHDFTKTGSRYAKKVNEIKKLKIKQSSNSNFYIELELFTVEEEPSAPLVVQFNFIDLKTNNLIKQESLNLNLP